MKAHETFNPYSATGSDLERAIAESVSNRLDESLTLLLNPGDDERVETGRGDNRFQYSPDIIIRDKSSGRKIIIEIKGQILGAITATLSRFRAIQRAVEAKGDLFLVVLHIPGNRDNWIFNELGRLDIDYVDATQAGAAVEKINALVSRLRHH